jgi:hypothetical protein
MILIPSAGKISPTTEKHCLRDFTEEYRRNQFQKINKAMKDIELLEFGTPNSFIDLCDIIKSHTKKDLLWFEELAKVADTTLGEVKRFMEHPIRARIVLQKLNTILVKY